MKNKFIVGMSKIAIATVLSTAMAATPVLASTGDLWKGSTNIGNVTQLILHPATFLDLLAHTSSYSYEVNGKGYDILQSDAMFKAHPTSSAADVQTMISTQLTGTPVATQSLAVASVSAINATQVQVTFTQAVATGAAQTLTNYTLGAATNPSAAVLQADSKTVLLTFTPAQLQVTNAVFLVAPIVSKADATVSSTQYAGLLTAKDTVAPTIAKVVSTTNSSIATSVTVTYSEPVAPTGTLKIDGTSYAVTAGTTQTISGLSLDATKTHTIQYVNLTDLAPTPNVTALGSTTFSITLDAVAPVVSSVAPYGDKQILVTFSKDMGASLPAANFSVFDDSLVAAGGAVTVSPLTGDTTGTKWVVDFTAPATFYTATNVTSKNLTLLIKGTVGGTTVADTQGNVIANSTNAVTLTKDTVKPQITGVTVTRTPAGLLSKIVVSSSKELKPAAAMTAAVLAPLLTVTDKNGVLVDTTAWQGGLQANAVLAGDTTLTIVPTTAAAASGTYTITFAAGLLSDTALTTNTSPAVTDAVDFGTTTTTGTFTIPSASFVPAAFQPSTTANVYKVAFGTPVKGGTVAGSATNLSSYTINGSALPVGTTITLDSVTSNTTATITLPTGTIAKTDTAAVFYISGIQDANGNTVVPATTTAQVNDNIAPTLTGAVENTDKTVSLSFSEAVAGLVPADLSITVNGGAALNPATDYTVAAGLGADAGKWVVTFTTAPTAGQAIVFKTTGTTGADAANNKVVANGTATVTAK